MNLLNISAILCSLTSEYLLPSRIITDFNRDTLGLDYVLPALSIITVSHYYFCKYIWSYARNVLKIYVVVVICYRSDEGEEI